MLSVWTEDGGRTTVSRSLLPVPGPHLGAGCSADAGTPSDDICAGGPPHREDQRAWISGLFSPENLDDTVAALADASDEDPTAGAAVALKRRIAAAQSAMDRLQRALEAGWDPEALTGQYNAAVVERRAAEAAFAALEPSDRLTAEEIRGVVAELGDMREVLDRANRRDLAELYRALSLSISYDHEKRGAVVSISPAMRVVKVGVRGGTCTLKTQFQRAS
jgi:hypothetical protein